MSSRRGPVMAERWHIERGRGVWLVRGDERAAVGMRGEAIGREAAAARVDAWFPEGFRGEGEATLAAIRRALDGAFAGSLAPDAGRLKATLRRAIRDGRLTAVRVGLGAPISGVGAEVEARARQPDALESIRFVVVEDETWSALAGIALGVTLPGGTQKTATTGEDGSIEHAGIKRGVCDVTSPTEGARLSNSFEVVSLDLGEPPPPAPDAGKPDARRHFAMTIHRHKVKRDETLDSVARGYGLTWKRLADFNWGTTDPEQINRHLYADVGCRERTRDRKNYLFDDEDDPGILYIPRPWRRGSIDTDRTYTLRLRVPWIAKPKKKVFLFSF